MCVVAKFQHRTRLLAGNIANMHWALDQVYKRDNNDPRLPQMRENLDNKLQTHHDMVEQLERVKIAAIQAQTRNWQHTEFIKHKCAKRLQNQIQTFRDKQCHANSHTQSLQSVPNLNDP